jgi:hypothetical protein
MDTHRIGGYFARNFIVANVLGDVSPRATPLYVVGCLCVCAFLCVFVRVCLNLYEHTGTYRAFIRLQSAGFQIWLRLRPQLQPVREPRNQKLFFHFIRLISPGGSCPARGVAPPGTTHHQKGHADCVAKVAYVSLPARTSWWMRAMVDLVIAYSHMYAPMHTLK